MTSLTRKIRNDNRNNRGAEFLETGNLTDCEFIVGASGGVQKTFRCHKMLLAVASPVFEAMFYGALSEDNKVISVTDVEVSAFETMLEYIYAAKSEIKSLDHGVDVAYIATKYMLEQLLEECINYIILYITPSTVCHVLELALLIDAVALQEKCMQIIQHETMEVLLCESFTTIERSTLEKILDTDELNISSELDIFAAVEKWAVANSEKHNSQIEEMRTMLVPLLKKIRFLSLSPTQFAEGPAQSPLLTKDDVLAILMNTVTKGATKYPMPEEFCSLTKPRRVPTYMNLVSYQVGSKKYCVRKVLKLSGEIICKKEGKDCFLWFSCDISTSVCGIQVSAQIQPENITSDTYLENFVASIFDSDGILLQTTIYEEHVRYNGIVELSFDQSVSIIAGSYYQLHIFLLKGGKYPKAQCKLTSLCEEVSLTFKDAINDGIIRSVICQ